MKGTWCRQGDALGHPSCKTERGAANCARVGAPTAHAIAYWGKEQTRRLPSAPGMRGLSMVVPLQQVLGPTLEHPQQTWTYAAAANVPSQPSAALLSPLYQMAFLSAIFPAFLREIAQAAAPQGRELMSQGQPPQDEPSPGSPPSIPHSPKHCGFLW